MIANVNVLSTALLHSVTGNEDGALVVTIDWDRSNLNPEFLNQGFDPDCLSRAILDRHILGFCRR